MTIFFAQSPCDLNSLVATFSARISAQPELKWAILIDTAFDHGAQTPHREALINGYTGHETLHGLEALAPCLYPLRPESDRGRRQLSALLAHCNGRPMWSLIGTPLPIAALAEEWQAYWQADIGDGQRMLLRFADTRVLATLPALLGEQWAALAAPLAAWLYPNRLGELTDLPMTPGSKPPVQITLSPEQLGQFTQVAEADSHLGAWWHLTPGIFDAKSPAGEYHGWVETACQLADAFGIDSWTDRQTLASLAIAHRGPIDQDRGLTALLKLRAWSPGRLADAIRLASDQKT